MKNEYVFEKGTHYSKGKKEQPTMWPLLLLTVGIILQFVHGVAIWYSLACYSAAIASYWYICGRLKYTYMRVVFDQSCQYSIDGPDAFDINKLFGIGFGDHMNRSARFGWNCLDGKIWIYAYVHNEGKMESKRMLSCLYDDPVDLCLKITDHAYEFTSSTRGGERAKESFPRRRSWVTDLMVHRLFPYFGGNKTAPHGMKLEMTAVH